MLKKNDNELCIELDPGMAFGTGASSNDKYVFKSN